MGLLSSGRTKCWVLLLAPSLLLATCGFVRREQKVINDYYVSTEGNDANAGTQGAPWRTLQHAADNVVLGSGGAIIHVAPGTYRDMYYCSVGDLVHSTSMVCIQKSGTPTQPIVFQSDETWQAKLSCTKRAGMFLLVGSYIRVVGFDVTCPLTGAYAGATYGDNGHNEFLNNYLHDFDVEGCTSVGVLNGTVTPRPGWKNFGHNVASGNVIRHAGAMAGAPHNCTQEHGLYFTDPYDVLTNNVISGIIGLGIHSYGGGICHQVITNNTVFDNSQGGILLENVATSSGYWDECGNGGMSDYNTVTNNIVVHNGVGRSYTGFNGGIDASGSPSGGHNLFSNNLLYGNRPRDTHLASPDTSSHGETGSDGTLFLSYQPDQNWAPNPNYDYLRYQLRAGSPAIDAGTTACAPGVIDCTPKVDIIGTPRPQANAIDIGAFEFTSATK